MSLAPITPGEILRIEFMEARGLTVAGVSAISGLPCLLVEAVIRGEFAIDAEISSKLSRTFGTSDGFWLNLQSIHDNTKEKMQQSLKAFAKAAYEAYLESSDGKSIATGATLPTWEKQSPAICRAWECAAAAAITAYQQSTGAPQLPDESTKRIAGSLAKLLTRDPHSELARAIRGVKA